jgi:triosephosphate isomerase (TIM)
MLMRTLFIAGNWKMNPTTLAQAKELAGSVKAGVGAATDVLVAVFPPAVFLHELDAALAGSPIGLGGQNIHWKTEGAFTGDVSAIMLIDAGCTHVILGHSERRHGVGETDAQINLKLKAALEAGLIPIVCVGETRREREAGETREVVRGQLAGSLLGDFADSAPTTTMIAPPSDPPFEISAEQMNGVVIAYEPVWAIGTGLTATPEQAQEVHAGVRVWLGERFGQATAGRVVVQYGGSVTATNARELLACPDIDGALVGGASLKPDFLEIIQAARTVQSAVKSQA